MERGGKVDVPFYWPSQRMSLPTPCDIIREARADVLGLRPVPTSRPFTPKQRERVLFGGAKRGSTRPPSAVNLSYLQRQEPSIRVKLPTIATSNRTRQRTVTARNVVSLDNLTEEPEGETLTTIWVQNDELQDLVGERKSYSCPQERTEFSSPSTNYASSSQTERIRRIGWTPEFSSSKNPDSGFVRQNSEPVPRKKKIHRLQSLPTEQRQQSADEEKVLEKKRVEVVPSIPEGELKDTPQRAKKHTENAKSINESKIKEEVAPALSAEIQNQPKVEETPLPQSVEESSNLIAVLSDGKLVWEEPPQRQKSPIRQSQDGEQITLGTDAQLKNLRNNMQQMSNRVRTLHKQVEKLGERGTSKNGSEISFHMNSKTRYHTVSKSKSSTGEKAYKKWAENNKSAEPEETETKQRRPETAGWDFFWKNSYFRTKEEPLDPALQYLSDVLEQLRTMHSNGDVSTVEEKIGSLYVSLKSGDFFSQGNLPTSFKSKLLQTLYMFADSDIPKLLLLIARIVLALRVESGLPAACKMIFKVARNDSNDNLFLDIDDMLELFLDGIGRASPLEAADSCIYGYGALKFLTMNSLLLSRVLHLGALDLVTLHLKMVNSSAEEGTVAGEQVQHALFQLTATLRNIAAGEGALPLFLTTNCIPALCKTLIIFRNDTELVSNISRTLSILSSHEETTQSLLSDDKLLLTLLDLLGQYQKNEQILIRLGYCLGNILANSDVARIQLSRHERTLPTLLAILQLYMSKTPTDRLTLPDESNKEINMEDGGGENIIDDVIVKIIRVVANMSMNPVVGSNLSPATQEKSSILLATLLAQLLKKQGPAQLAALGCLNNISYYVTTHSSVLHLTECVMEVLRSAPSHDCIIESCRVLGNLTRHKDTRESIFKHGGMEVLLKLLQMMDLEIVRCVCGVLVNMLLDSETRHNFLSNKGVDTLVHVAERYEGDWLLAGLVCRGIWNACAQDIASAMEHNDMDHLLTTFANYLEEDNWKDSDSDWEEFAEIATDLLERFNTYLESTQ